MRIKNMKAREKWRRSAEVVTSGKSEYVRATVPVYLDIAEKWAEAIEDSWDWNASDVLFAEAAQATYKLLLDGIPSMEIGGTICNFFVLYLIDTWEFGKHLRRWYKNARK